jgi:phage I-like protein
MNLQQAPSGMFPRLHGDDGAIPSDGWFMVSAKGEFPISLENTRTGEKQTFIQVLDDVACAAMFNRYQADKAANPGLELLVDFDHFSDQLDRRSEAAGWIVDLQNRADGLYASIRWSDLGEQAVTGRRYRFFSPVWEPRDCEVLGNNRIRPLRLDKAALTNEPRMRNIQPLFNRATGPADGMKGTMEHKKMLCDLLGLPADATDQQIQNACTELQAKIKNRVEAETQLTALTTERDGLLAKVSAFETAELNRQVDADLETYKDRITNRDDVKAALLANREGTLKVLAALKVAPAAPVQKLLNRTDGKSPAPATQVETDRLDEQLKLVEEIKLKNRCSYTEAYNQAMTTKPELFRPAAAATV